MLALGHVVAGGDRAGRREDLTLDLLERRGDAVARRRVLPRHARHLELVLVPHGDVAGERRFDLLLAAAEVPAGFRRRDRKSQTHLHRAAADVDVARVERQHEGVERVLEGLEVEVVLRVGIGLLVLDEVGLEGLRRAGREIRVADVQAHLGFELADAERRIVVARGVVVRAADLTRVRHGLVGGRASELGEAIGRLRPAARRQRGRRCRRRRRGRSRSGRRMAIRSGTRASRRCRSGSRCGLPASAATCR